MNDDDKRLSYLRQDAADALRIYIRFISTPPLIKGNPRWDEQCNVAALGYIAAQAKYTLACHEVQRGEILPYVELPDA